MDHHSPRILRRPAVEDLTGLSRSTLYAYMKDGTFPRPVRLGAKAVGWIEGEVLAWIRDRTAERNVA